MMIVNPMQNNRWRNRVLEGEVEIEHLKDAQRELLDNIVKEIKVNTFVVF